MRSRILLPLEQAEATWLLAAIGAKIRKLRRHHASPRAERRREAAGVEPYGDRRDADKFEIEAAERLLARLQEQATDEWGGAS